MKPVLGLVLLALVCGPAQAAAGASARLIGLDGKEAGRATLRSAAHGVLVEIDVHGLSPGAHAVTIHTTGSCDPKKLFTSAGPDFSFDPKKPHGYFAKGGPRPGQLPNQFADEAGRLHATMFTSAFSLGNGKKSIFDRDGASIIVRAKADDYTSQPDGNSGARVACGTIIRTSGPGTRKGGSHRKHQ